jgi:tetratricopeptide (TPR) repeat protein
MQHRLIQSVGIAWTILFAVFIIWIYATEPRTFKEVAAGAQSAAGAYKIDEGRFNAALDLFHREQYRAARVEWEEADPGHKDARTQFYIAYAFYREGWGNIYYTTDLFKQGLEAANLAIELSPEGTLTVDDPDLQMHTAAELKAELEQGLEWNLSDFNPLKIFRKRK